MPISTFYQARELARCSRHADVACLLTLRAASPHDYLERPRAAAPASPNQDGRAPLRLTSLPYLRRVRVCGRVPERGWCGTCDVAALGERRRKRRARQTTTYCVPSRKMFRRRSRDRDHSSDSTAARRGPSKHTPPVVRHGFTMSHTYEVRGGAASTRRCRFFLIRDCVTSLLSAIQCRRVPFLAEEAFEPARTLDLLERERAEPSRSARHTSPRRSPAPELPGRDLSSIRTAACSTSCPGLPGRRTTAARQPWHDRTCGPTRSATVPWTYQAAPPAPSAIRSPASSARSSTRRANNARALKPADLRARLQPDAGPLQARARRGLRRRQLLSHHERRLLRCGGWLFFQGRLGEV